MSYWMLPASGIPVSRTMVQLVTYIDTCNNSSKKLLKVYDKAIKDIFHKKHTEESFTGPNSTKPNIEMWAELAEDEEYFQS